MSEPSDDILLEGLRFYAYHGVNPEERVLGQRFIVPCQNTGAVSALGNRVSAERVVLNDDP